jgi:Ca-activated chloride channel family protein
MTKQIFFLNILLAFLILTQTSSAYSYLTVNDPRNWNSMPGTIEQATITVKPKGIFMEIGLYLTFSARGWYAGSNDSLEVVFNFQLPENSIVYDSWLWIEKEIIRADIMDQWTASTIYETIVNRRRDPSILFKRSQTDYELRIYPLIASSTRRVKISYLVTAQWNSNETVAPIPTDLLLASKFPVSPIYLQTVLDEKWKNPYIIEFPDIHFVSGSDTVYGEYLRAEIPTDKIQGSINFALDSPLQDGVYLNRYQQGDEGIYQLAFLPSEALSIASSYKAAILIDYDASNSDVTTTEILNSLKSYLLANKSDKDSFNLIFSNLNIKRASETWLAADSATIEQTFSSLGNNPISSYSNLPSLLANGIEFMKQNGNNGNIVLVSNSDQVGDYIVANQLINDLLELMDQKIPIHVADFQTQNFDYHFFSGRYYLGNEYFYTNITRITSANYFNISSYSNFQYLISTTLNSLSGFISSFDLHTRLASGYCYSRYNLGSQSNLVYLEKPILQIGKYKGSFPFIIEASGEYDSLVFSQQIMIEDENIDQADSLSEEAWAGNYLRFLELSNQTNDVVNEIVNYSIDERVLSIYSAFLCLDPSLGGEVCYDCFDDGGIIGEVNEDDNAVSDSVITAYPNPFNSQVQINVPLRQIENAEYATFRIYNVLGQVVRNFEVNASLESKDHRFIWNGQDDEGATVSSGIYFFVVNTPKKNYSVKLLYMK